MTTYYSQNKDHLVAYKKNTYRQNIINKKYYCRKCDKSYRDLYQFNRHLRSKQHNGIKKRYPCPHNGCSYISNAQFHLDGHLNSRKHRSVADSSDSN